MRREALYGSLFLFKIYIFKMEVITMITEEQKQRLENTLWRTEEGLTTLDKLVDILDEDTFDQIAVEIVELREAWLGGIKHNVEEILDSETKED